MEEEKKEGQEPKISPEKEKKMENQSITLLVVLMILLAAFIGGYFAFKPKPYFEYEQFKIYPINYEGSNLMFYSIPLKFDLGQGQQEQNIVLRNDPRQLENLSYNIDKELFKIAAIGFTMEPTLNVNAVLAAKEIAGLTVALNIPTAFGVTKDFEGKTDNIFDCENATNLTRVIRMELGNETKVYGKDKCIIVEGYDYINMIKAADKLAFEWLKLITSKNETD